MTPRKAAYWLALGCSGGCAAYGRFDGACWFSGLAMLLKLEEMGRG